MSSEATANLKSIATVVRALVTSRKPPVPLRDIVREYLEVENRPLPYKEYGYKTPQEFLEQTREFNFQRIGNEVFIIAQLNKKSSHIASLVRGQKSSKSKGLSKPANQARQPKPTDYKGWNKTSYSTNVYARQPPKPKDLRTPPQLNRGYRVATTTTASASAGDRNNNLIDSKKPNENTKAQPQSQQQSKTQANKPAPTQTAGVKSKPLQEIETQNNKQTENNIQYKDLRDKLNANKASSKTMMQQAQQQPQQQLQQQQQRHQYQQQQQQMQNQHKNYNDQNDLNDMMNNKLRLENHQQQQKQQQQQKSILQERLNSAQQMQAKEANQRPNQKQQGTRAILGNGAIPTSAPASNKVHSVVSHGGGGAPVQRSSVQQRLRVIPKNDVVVPPTSNGTGTKTPQSPLTPSSSASSSPLIISAGTELQKNPFVPAQQRVQHSFSNNSQRPYYQSHPSRNEDPVALLAKYCAEKKFGAPVYSCSKSKFQRTVLCRVSLNGIVYSTYPHEYPDEIAAKIACAKIAMEKIKEQDAKQALPPCQYTDEEFIEVLHTELLKHPTGIFAKNMDKWYESTFNEKLKDNWWTLVHRSKQFNTEVNCDNIIVFANANVVTSKDDVKRSPSADSLLHIEPIDLPWAENCWNLCITYCESTVEVWGRLFGDEYSARFDALVEEIDNYMQQAKSRPRSITPQQIYLVNICKCWHRVRVEKLDKENGKAQCFFIDFGDAEWITVDKLYICELKFLQLPAQAVPFLLYGLEDFAGNPYANSILETELCLKTFVAQICTKELDYYNTDSNTCGKVKVVLYDTSTHIDININEKLRNRFCDASQPPKLNAEGVPNVIVSHVSDDGEIFLCLRNDDSKYVETLLHNITASKIKYEQHQATAADLRHKNVFLVADDSDGSDKPKWHRAMLAKTQRNGQGNGDNDEVFMFYIDNGVTRRTHISKIYRLESLSTALYKFPPQAIRVHLHNIPAITSTIVGRIRALLPSNCEALIKVAEINAAGTFVIAYIRQESGTLCNVNDTIRIEHELEQFSRGGNSEANGTSSKGRNTDTPTKPIKDMVMGLIVPNSPAKNMSLPKLKEYGELPIYDNNCLEVRVTLSANPGNFTIQPYRDYPTLKKLMTELQEYCMDNDEFIPADMVEIGQAYAAKHTNGFYHRVTVVNIFGDMIHVLFCDFGDVSVLKSDQLKILPEAFRQLPQMAIQAKLYGIVPVQGSWTHDDCIRFRQLTVGQKFVSIVRRQSKDENGSRVLELDLIDVSTEVDIYIHEQLIKEQRAVIAT